MKIECEAKVFDTVITGLTVFCPRCNARNYIEFEQDHVICCKCKMHINVLW